MYNFTKTNVINQYVSSKNQKKFTEYCRAIAKTISKRPVLYFTQPIYYRLTDFDKKMLVETIKFFGIEVTVEDHVVTAEEASSPKNTNRIAPGTYHYLNNVTYANYLKNMVQNLAVIEKEARQDRPMVQAEEKMESSPYTAPNKA